MPDEIYDLAIIGGGINGASIARAAAVAGHSVLLVEQGDLGQATSSASTKLIHGGLRYLEHFAFGLVRESLRERDIMLRAAPHIARPLEFRLPHDGRLRPWWLVRLGLRIYDGLAGRRSLPRSRAITLAEAALKIPSGRGFSYWDGWVDDSRLVVLNAIDAAEAGASICTRTRCVGARRSGGGWSVDLHNDGGQTTRRARILINAAGPWVDQVLRDRIGFTPRHPIRLVRGSHIILARRLPQEHAYLLQQEDGRIVFIIPYQGDLTLVGTTDVAVGSPDESAISQGEADYLLAAVNRYLRDPATPEDIVGHFAGIRALADSGKGRPSAANRGYDLVLESGLPPLLTVRGGKITTARHLAETVLDTLGLSPGAGTRARALPGGDFADFDAFLGGLRARWPFLPAATAERLARAYGTRAARMLAGVTSSADLGEDFGHGLTACEIDYLVAAEWARNSEDILWRRTKLGLRLSPLQVSRVQAYLARGRA